MTQDPVVLQRIDEVVQRFVDEGRMFTAFEVSLAVKETGVRERHRNMRGAVHASVAKLAGDHYTRTLRDVGAPVQAWVYHGLRANPHDYEPLERDDDSAPAAASGRAAGGAASGGAAGASARGAAASQPPSRGAAPRNPQPLSAAASVAPATESDGAYGTDQQGRLVIPPAALASLGVGAGDQVQLACDTDNQEIRLWRPTTVALMQADATLEVDADGKLRLDSALLSQADLDGMQCYRILGRGNLITIRDFS